MGIAIKINDAADFSSLNLGKVHFFPVTNGLKFLYNFKAGEVGFNFVTNEYDAEIEVDEGHDGPVQHPLYTSFGGGYQRMRTSTLATEDNTSEATVVSLGQIYTASGNRQIAGAFRAVQLAAFTNMVYLSPGKSKNLETPVYPGFAFRVHKFHSDGSTSIEYYTNGVSTKADSDASTSTRTYDGTKLIYVSGSSETDTAYANGIDLVSVGWFNRNVTDAELLQIYNYYVAKYNGLLTIV